VERQQRAEPPSNGARPHLDFEDITVPTQPVGHRTP
jgi:hypothetical protein